MNKNENWRLCHPVNIYVYRNGVVGEPPTLVHIPSESKKNMETVLDVIQSRVKCPVGYANELYYTNGIKVCRTSELEMYENYVVLTNLEKYFKCIDYGRGRTPLVVIGPESKNIRSIRQQNSNFEKINARKRDFNDRRMKYGFASHYQPDGYGPSDLPYVNNASRECGVLCHKLRACGRCKKQSNCDPRLNVTAVPDGNCSISPSCDMVSEACTIPTIECNTGCRVKRTSEHGTSCNRPLMVDQTHQTESECRRNSIDADHILEFVNRYRDIGDDLYRLFTERMSKDMDEIRAQFSARSFVEKEKQGALVGENLYNLFRTRIREAAGGSKDFLSLTKGSYFGNGREEDYISSSDNDFTTTRPPSAGNLFSGGEAEARQKSALESIEDWKRIDDKGTGHSAAINSNDTSKQIPRTKKIKDASLTDLIENKWEVPTGTTRARNNINYETPKNATTTNAITNATTIKAKAKATTKTVPTNIYHMTLEEQLSPFIVKNGMLEVKKSMDFLQQCSQDYSEDASSEASDSDASISTKAREKAKTFRHKKYHRQKSSSDSFWDIPDTPESTRSRSRAKGLKSHSETRTVSAQAGNSFANTQNNFNKIHPQIITSQSFEFPSSQSYWNTDNNFMVHPNWHNSQMTGTSSFLQPQYISFTNIQPMPPNRNNRRNDLLEQQLSSAVTSTPPPTIQQPVFDSNGNVLYYMIFPAGTPRANRQ